MEGKTLLRHKEQRGKQFSNEKTRRAHRDIDTQTHIHTTRESHSEAPVEVRTTGQT